MRLTPGQVDARPLVPRLGPGLCGHLCGARGALAQALHDTLVAQGLELLTTSRQNMQPRLRRLWDTRLLRKRSLSETINDPWKHIRQSEPARPRSVTGCMVHLVAGVVA